MWCLLICPFYASAIDIGENWTYTPLKKRTDSTITQDKTTGIITTVSEKHRVVAVPTADKKGYILTVDGKPTIYPSNFNNIVESGDNYAFPVYADINNQKVLALYTSDMGLLPFIAPAEKFEAGKEIVRLNDWYISQIIGRGSSLVKGVRVNDDRPGWLYVASRYSRIGLDAALQHRLYLNGPDNLPNGETFSEIDCSPASSEGHFVCTVESEETQDLYCLVDGEIKFNYDYTTDGVKRVKKWKENANLPLWDFKCKISPNGKHWGFVGRRLEPRSEDIDIWVDGEKRFSIDKDNQFDVVLFGDDLIIDNNGNYAIGARFDGGLDKEKFCPNKTNLCSYLVVNGKINNFLPIETFIKEVRKGNFTPAKQKPFERLLGISFDPNNADKFAYLVDRGVGDFVELRNSVGYGSRILLFKRIDDSLDSRNDLRIRFDDKGDVIAVDGRRYGDEFTPVLTKKPRN